MSSPSHGLDLFQLLDIASGSLVADDECSDCRLLPITGRVYVSHAYQTRQSQYLRQKLEEPRHLSLVIQASVEKGRQALAKRVGSGLFDDFTSSAAAPLARDTLLGSKTGFGCCIYP